MEMLAERKFESEEDKRRVLLSEAARLYRRAEAVLSFEAPGSSYRGVGAAAEKQAMKLEKYLAE